MRNYIQEVRWYIYTLLKGQVYTHVIVILNHNNAQVSTVTVYPPSKASSCEPNNGSKNKGKKIDYIFILSVLKGSYLFSPLKIFIFTVLKPFYLFYYISLH
jgi:hypothetical protein